MAWGGGVSDNSFFCSFYLERILTNQSMEVNYTKFKRQPMKKIKFHNIEDRASGGQSVQNL